MVLQVDGRIHFGISSRDRIDSVCSTGNGVELDIIPGQENVITTRTTEPRDLAWLLHGVLWRLPAEENITAAVLSQDVLRWLDEPVQRPDGGETSLSRAVRESGR